MTISDFTVETSDGRSVSLSEYRDRVLLVVNVASQCSFTPQYEGLEALYRKFKDRGFAVLGFPCNQFLWQEPGDASRVQACPIKYNVTFPVFAKIKVNGANAHPLYKWLKSQRPGLFGTGFIKWNFGKFLLNRQGDVATRFSMFTKPAAIESEIVAMLDAK